MAYCAVIFTSQRRRDPSGGFVDEQGYREMDIAMSDLAARQPGYLGIEGVRGADGMGMTASYWASEAEARDWGHDPAHRRAQMLGRERWYEWYAVRVTTVEREWSHSAGR